VTVIACGLTDPKPGDGARMTRRYTASFLLAVTFGARVLGSSYVIPKFH